MKFFYSGIITIFIINDDCASPDGTPQRRIDTKNIPRLPCLGEAMSRGVPHIKEGSMVMGKSKGCSGGNFECNGPAMRADDFFNRDFFHKDRLPLQCLECDKKRFGILHGTSGRLFPVYTVTDNLTISQPYDTVEIILVPVLVRDHHNGLAH